MLMAQQRWQDDINAAVDSHRGESVRQMARLRTELAAEMADAVQQARAECSAREPKDGGVSASSFPGPDPSIIAELADLRIRLRQMQDDSRDELARTVQRFNEATHEADSQFAEERANLNARLQRMQVELDHAKRELHAE